MSINKCQLYFYSSNEKMEKKIKNKSYISIQPPPHAKSETSTTV